VNPREFLGFFKTRTGKLLSFVALSVAAALVFTNFCGQPDSAGANLSSPSSVMTNRLKPSQIVHTVERPMEVYRPPVSPPETPGVVVQTNEVLARILPIPVTTAVTSLPALPLSLVADSPSVTVAPIPKTPVYAPYGRLIPCETVITIDSASIQTPIIGLITEDIYHAGRLVIPAGTEVHGTAQTDRLRERISSGGGWTLVWRTGEELRLKGIVLDREFSSSQEGWGITDGSAGMRGRIIKSDDLAEIKLFAATLLSGAAAALTEKETTLFGSMDRRSLNNAPLKGAQDVLQVFAQRIQDAIQRDGFYVRVPSGKQFYLYVLQTIDRNEAVVGNGNAPGSSSIALRDSPSSSSLHSIQSAEHAIQPFSVTPRP
jgi:hypothetical protein